MQSHNMLLETKGKVQNIYLTVQQAINTTLGDRRPSITID